MVHFPRVHNVGCILVFLCLHTHTHNILKGRHRRTKQKVFRVSIKLFRNLQWPINSWYRQTHLYVFTRAHYHPLYQINFYTGVIANKYRNTCKFLVTFIYLCCRNIHNLWTHRNLYNDIQ